jgi:hypothetical protein
MAEKSKAGHRQRLKERFLAGAQGSRSQERLLELLLTFAIARKDVRPIAQELIRVFGSLSKVLSASSNELSKVKGVGQSSVALLKAIDFVQLYSTTHKSKYGQDKRLDSTEPMLFEASPEKTEAEVERPALSSQPKNIESKLTYQKSTRRKFQVSNGYLLEFDQLARVLHFLLENRDARKINRKSLRENTGLADRQVAGLISIGAAMGLIQPGCQILTPTGLLIAQHDIFIEKRSSLEWCHYAGAGTYRNLVWFEIFNHLLIEEPTMTQEGWNKYFRFRLDGQYSGKTIKDHVPKEVRFVIDAYLERNLSKLEILLLSSDLRLYRRRYTSFNQFVFSAMIYDFCASRGAQLFQVGEMAVMPGSPALIFGLDPATFRHQIEALHDQGWLRYETTHNLDQIRLKPGFSAIKFLAAHYKNEEL